jgi:putative SOS response-associated peptidase YedK
MISAKESHNLQVILGLPKIKELPLKAPSDDGRVFSKYFANVIVSENEQRLIKPMRYRVRPNGSKEEVPTKYNVFNARLDSLEIRQTWIPLFMHNHGSICHCGNLTSKIIF